MQAALHRGERHGGYFGYAAISSVLERTQNEDEMAA